LLSCFRRLGLGVLFYFFFGLHLILLMVFLCSLWRRSFLTM
jgi:hypothetical protein